jgi:hypothetical protein
MTGGLLGNDLFDALEEIRKSLEADNRGTVFTKPGTPVAPLPDALGGDQTKSYFLAAPAKGKEGFFALLHAKAHFLTLPKRIVEFLRDSSKVWLSEAATGPGAAAETNPSYDSDGNILSVEMRFPMASEGLVYAGHNLGRPAPQAGGEYALMGTIYHEMTHALLMLSEDADVGIQTLNDDGSSAYNHSVGANGTEFDGSAAFTEAAAYYVEDLVVRWGEALSSMSRLLFLPEPKPDRDWFLLEVSRIVEKYDHYVPVYGTVGFKDGPNEDIKEPWLLDDLRDKINERILDGRPLTKRFDDTPLADLREALLGH